MFRSCTVSTVAKSRALNASSPFCMSASKCTVRSVVVSPFICMTSPSLTYLSHVPSEAQRRSSRQLAVTLGELWCLRAEGGEVGFEHRVEQIGALDAGS